MNKLNWIWGNRLYDLARQGQRLTPWWAILPLSVVIVFGSSIFGLPIELIEFWFYGLSGTPTRTEPDLLSASLFTGLTLAFAFGGIILAVWLWIRFYERRSFVTLGFERQGALGQYVRGLLIGLLAFSGAVGFMALFGYIDIEASDPAQVGVAALGSALITLLLGWLIQGAAEEVLTRGWMMPVLSARYRPWIGILVSSLFFGIMHGINPNLSVLAMLNLILYGLFGAMYALREESLWGICAFHSIWNWAQGNLFGLAVSGQNINTGTIFNLVETGPDWFTGGAFGPEGGLAVTVVLVIGMVMMVIWPQPVATVRT